MDIFPDFSAVGGAADLESIAGALLTFVLIVAVLIDSPALRHEDHPHPQRA